MMNDYENFISEEKQERHLLNDEAYKKKMAYNQNEESNINDETQLDSNYSYSYLQNSYDFINTNADQSSFLIKTEKTKKNKTTLKNKKKKESNIPIMIEEFKDEIEKLVDKQFEEEYTKLNNEYEEKIEELLIEQEKIFNKNEMLKAKCNALENYLKNYCKKANIDYDSLISN